MVDLKNMTIKNAHKGLRDKLFSASELTESIFEVAANSESVLHAHLLLMHEEAVQGAKETDQRISKDNMLGALDGIPISIKRKKRARANRHKKKKV